ARKLDDDASVQRVTHPCDPSFGSPRAVTTGKSRSALTGGGRNLGGKIGFLLLNSLAQRVTHEAGDLDRNADRSLGFFQRLRDALGRIVDVGLLEQTDFLVESLQPGFDDL